MKSPLIKISDEELENLRFDTKLKNYEISLRKSPLNVNVDAELTKGTDGKSDSSSTLLVTSSRPQFRVPFFFKSS